MVCHRREGEKRHKVCVCNPTNMLVSVKAPSTSCNQKGEDSISEGRYLLQK